MKTLTIQEILNNISTVEKGYYRKRFEEEKVNPPKDSLLEKLKDILVFKPVTGKIYGDEISYYHCGSRYCIVLRDITVDEYGGAHGLTYKMAFYIVDLEKKKIIYSEGPYTYRGGHAADIDAWHLAFREVRILEESDKKLIFGLKSNEMLVIKRLALGKNGANKAEIVEEYDLKQEEKEKKKKESVEKAINELEEESLRALLKSLYGDNTWISLKRLSENIVLSMIQYYDRDYDAKVDLIKFFAILKGKGIVELGNWRPASYHPPFKYHEVRASIRNADLQEEKNKFMIKVEVEVRQWDYSTVLGRKDNRLQDEKVFYFEITK